MDKYVTKLYIGQPSSSSRPSLNSHIAPEIQRETISPPSSNVDCSLELGSLERDPKERRPIFQFSPNIRDKVRRYYIKMGPYQPELKLFPKTKFGDKMRQFNPDWYKPLYSGWLEYSIKDAAAFCLCCYLFKNEFESRGNVGRAFADDGFRSWNHGPARLKSHVGEVNSTHNKCFNRMLDLKNQRQSIRASFSKLNEKDE
ncbi:uncharacterized protein LOC132624745 [Lycium barbarum]|uniref:uncharacterized protein LOC132624745 n=1 Tax=Lycium barbarum TaxID=112863 RepID=UPI00293EA823|nr:uncharacterized protein LOC132624745 [Lycium barbarum]